MTSLRFFMLFLALTVAGITAGAAAQPPAQGATATRFLQQKHQAVERVLRRPAKNAQAVERRNAEVTRMLGDLLDYEALARESLGSQWQARSEAERREFVTLLRQLVERSYQDNLNRTVQFTVRYD